MKDFAVSTHHPAATRANQRPSRYLCASALLLVVAACSSDRPEFGKSATDAREVDDTVVPAASATVTAASGNASEASSSQASEGSDADEPDNEVTDSGGDDPSADDPDFNDPDYDPETDDPDDDTRVEEGPAEEDPAGDLIDVGMTPEPVETSMPVDCESDAECECEEGETQPCGPEAEVGICRPGFRPCHNGRFGECEGAVEPGVRDCTSVEDSDCDGLPDNTIDTICRCAPGTQQECDSHPGFDGNGSCRAGTQECDLSQGGSSSDWGVCVGAVGPALEDSCTVIGEDANCNGIPNDGCECQDASDCDDGIQCTTDACTNLTCSHMLQAGMCQLNEPCSAPGDCASGLCVSNVCVAPNCADGATRPCGTHPEDGVGTCTAGVETCSTAVDPTGVWGECVGSVGPQAESCGPTADDRDCDGVRGNGNGCTKTLHVIGSRGDGTADMWCYNTTDGLVLGGASFKVVEEFPSAEHTLAEYTEISSFKVFVSAFSGANVGIYNCRVEDPGPASFYYDFYTFAACTWVEDNGMSSQIMGYVASSSATGYQQLRQNDLLVGTSGGNYIKTAVLGSSAPSDCAPSNASLWTVP